MVTYENRKRFGKFPWFDFAITIVVKKCKRKFELRPLRIRELGIFDFVNSFLLNPGIAHVAYLRHKARTEPQRFLVAPGFNRPLGGMFKSPYSLLQ